jgi:hypothetical protein
MKQTILEINLVIGIWIKSSKFSSFDYFWHLSYLAISALIFFKQPDIVRIVSN